MTYKPIFKWSASLLLVMVFIYGCSDNPEVEESTIDIQVQLTYNESETVRNNGKFLDFAYYEEFENIRKYHRLPQPDSYESPYSSLQLVSPKALSEELNFQSMGRKYEWLQTVQKNYMDNIKARYEANPELFTESYVSGLSRFAPELYDNQHIIKLNEDNGTYELKVKDLDLAYLLNEDGVVAIGGAFYQYTDQLVKFIPIKDNSSYDQILSAGSEVPNLGLKVSEIQTEIISESVNDPVGPEFCTGDINGRLFINGIVEHRTFVVYEQETGCIYDNAYYSCWYGSAAGLPYNLRLAACCPPRDVPVVKSQLYARAESWSNCDVSILGLFCIGGNERANITTLGVSGNGTYVENGSTQSFNFNDVGTNIAVNTRYIYDGDRINNVCGIFNFTGTFTLIGTNTGACSINYQ